MLRSWGRVAALVLLTASTAAGAFEPPIGSRLGNRLKPLTNSSANMTRISARVAECKAAKYPGQTRAYLDAMDEGSQKAALQPLDRAQLCDFRSFIDATVEEVNIETEPKIFRGLLAEGVLKDSHRDKNLEPTPLLAKYERPWFAMTGREEAIDEMAVCIAAIDPQGIRGLFKTLHDSKQEGAALAAMGPSFGKCLESGFQLKANALSLRTALAEALYHRAYDPAPAQAGVGEDGGTSEAAE